MKGQLNLFEPEFIKDIHGEKGNDTRKRMQVLRILRKLRKAGKIHEVYGIQRTAAGSRQTES